MKYRKGLVFICLLICLFSIASICASDVNETVAASGNQNDDIIEIENQNEEININNNSDDNVKIEESIDDETDDSRLQENSDILSYSNELTVKSSTYPAYSDYSVKLSTSTIYESGGSILINITPASGSTYKYYFTLKIYDSNNDEKISKDYYDNRPAYSKTYSISAKQLRPGTYTMKIINYYDYKVMSTAKLIVKSSTYPYYSDYSVKLSNSTITYGSNGSISMDIIPASNSTNKYHYYLKIYDSNNNEKISKIYSGTSPTYSQTYSIGANQLSLGTYTMKIINYYDNKVMSTAKLTVEPSSTYPSYSDYSVHVSDSTVDYGDSGFISMSISPSPGSAYKYYYYLKVYDSDNNVKIFQSYYSTSSSYSKTYTLSANQLSPGTYTVEIINFNDNEVMDTATLTVNSPAPAPVSNVNKMPTKTVAPIVKKTVKITVKNVKGYQGKKVKITAVVKDGNGKKIKSGTVLIKFKGKTYRVKIKNGKAKKTIKIPKTSNRAIFYKYKKNKVTKVYQDVTYKGKVLFLGNKYYFDGSSTFKVTSKKKPKTQKYTPRHVSEETGEVSHKKHKTAKKQKKHKKVTKKKKAKKKKKSYGSYPKYHKKVPNLNVNLFKGESQFNTNINLKDIVIRT